MHRGRTALSWLPTGSALGRFCLVLVCLGAAVLASAPVPRPDFLSYLVVADRASPAGAADAAGAVRSAGGVLGAVHRSIGVAVGYATDPGFADRVRAAPGVRAAGATRTAPLPVPPAPPRRPPGAAGAGDGHRAFGDGGDAPPGSAGAGPPRTAAPGAAAGPGVPWRAGVRPAREVEPPLVPDPGERPTWNLAMIGAGHGHRGPPPGLARTVVAVMDSGVDDTHPDLRAAVDPERSVSCASGRPDTTPGAWRPVPEVLDSGHGTHIAGTIAAARDGRGIAGVAPGARIAAVRLLGPVGQYYPENIVCGLLWAADHGARVINNSYFADPWKYHCPSDPDQAAVIAAVARAVGYAQRRGALVVASAGNDGQDLRAVRIDRRSPNDRVGGPRPARHLGADCIRLPSQLPGVLAVRALDRTGSVTVYSNYGASGASLAAPGGDPGAGPDGQIISTWPGGGYAALSGTSMAAAHVSGAAALAAARHPGATPKELLSLLRAGPESGGSPSGQRILAVVG
ncbi:S8 family peptidase [Wenjunlia vitaminophila]|uniref:S8 family peptidase n=1 Tax=Wenjunlia vitaminophila TaxID=76728 RepID=UPI00035E529C|nr:S8 family serine peptidase [Wenjunlia vitaminophila]